MEDPEVYLAELGISLSCATADGQPARLDSTTRCYVNYEIFFFSDESERTRFESDPLQYCGIVTDPISRQRFRPTSLSPRFDCNDHPYYFFTEENMATFATSPMMYATPNYKMLPKDSTVTPDA